MTQTQHELDFRAVCENHPGPRWRSLFDEYRPAYERWYWSQGRTNRPRYLDCESAVAQHLPGMLPVYQQLVECAGADDFAARFLSMYRPPSVVAACSQLAWNRDGQCALLRNYDYAPTQCDGVILRSQWNAVPIIATTDCLIGALDGMNESGLSIALAFGGRRTVGDGFAAPMILRCALQSCDSAPEAAALIARIPIYMAYNFSILDSQGRARVVHARPGQEGAIEEKHIATNHQSRKPEWLQYASLTRTIERHDLLADKLKASQTSLDSLRHDFLRPPLWQSNYDRGAGTLYNAVFEPGARRITYQWPGHKWNCTMDDFREDEWLIHYTTTN